MTNTLLEIKVPYILMTCFPCSLFSPLSFFIAWFQFTQSDFSVRTHTYQQSPGNPGDHCWNNKHFIHTELWQPIASQGWIFGADTFSWFAVLVAAQCLICINISSTICKSNQSTLSFTLRTSEQMSAEMLLAPAAGQRALYTFIASLRNSFCQEIMKVTRF